MVFRLVALVACTQMSPAVSGDPNLLLTQMKAQAKRTAQQDPSKYPTQTSKGESADGSLNMWETASADNWVSGFFPGILWQLYSFTRDDEWATLALNWTEGMRTQQTNNHSHDIGFKVFNSFGMGLTLSPEGSFAAQEVERLGYKDVILTAADTLASRFSETIGCTLSWGFSRVCSTDKSYEAKFPVIIDNMMNLELLFWAAANGGDARLHHMAESHANVTARNHVRADGSTHHVVDYDPGTGDVLRQCTHQGLNDTSTWSRGQGWCVYGFTMSYRYTRLPLHLETAQRCAEFFLTQTERTVDDSVALWDFSWPGDRGMDRRDVSASALVASALLELADFVPADIFRYQDAAKRMIEAISVPATAQGGYLGDMEKTQGVLVHATVMNPEWSATGQDVSLIYGGYYAMEALRRLWPGQAAEVLV